MQQTAPRIEAPFTVSAQLEARARHSFYADRPLLHQDERTWTCRQYRDESVRYGHFLAEHLGARGGPRHVAMLLENHLELLALYGGCAYAGATLFGVNTGLRGDPLVGVIDQSRCGLLVVDEALVDRVDAVAERFQHLAPQDILVLPTRGGAAAKGRSLVDRIAADVGESGQALEAPACDVQPETNLMVIYTSGTTGLPKGINNNHMKLVAIGSVVRERMELGPEGCGYACMPLFHSNAIFLGFMPALVSGAAIGLRERFSARRFVPDVKRYGVTYWNYVGEPVHYVLQALEAEYGDDLARLREEVTDDPRNRLRYAVGNGASPPDIDRFIDWLGLEDMFEIYGSTEAAISTFRRKTDPRGSVGEVTDDAVQILDEAGRECPPARIDERGRFLNYDEAVGEICRVAPDTSLFQGYYDNAEANASKYRDGVYHSGDLGHLLLRDGRRFLFFDGRTDDWIRKDGENFSAAQVARLIQEHDDVALAAAYGVPCAVSDELVMCAVQLREGAHFEPQAFFDDCQAQVDGGSMDPKWIPDFVRIVDDFEFTQTQKILVRRLKQEHFDPARVGGSPVYWRERGDTTYRRFESRDFAVLRDRFVAAEREGLLER